VKTSPEKLERVRRYKAANREKCAAYSRAYHAANRDACRARARAYREANPNLYAEWVAANREALAARKAAYKKANAARNAAHASAYHAAKLQRVVPFSDMEKIAAVYADAAELRALGLDVHVDHFFPLRGRFVSGLHVHTNLRVVLAEDNQRKYNKFPE
jgi:hypothetical protein